MKILFICPDYFGLYKVIEKNIQETMNCEVKSIIFRDYKYKNSSEKIKNFLSKVFLNKNLKKIWASKERISTISNEDHFDYLFAICPDFLLEEDLIYLMQKANKSIVYYWDSFDNIPRYEKTFSLFDKHFSFEPKDVQKYKMNFITNFYYNENKSKKQDIDLFFIGTYDKRFQTILQILSIIKHRKTSVYIFTKKEKIIQKYKSESINFIRNRISVEESEQIFKNSKVILDVQKEIQEGLTFRVFEAMGHSKKLITTNQSIKDYDFYNPNNIFIWDNNTTEIPNSFFDEPYQELPEEIYKKYSIKTWVKTIFSEP